MQGESGIGNWADRLKRVHPAIKHLTLRDVAAMSARREVDGWYVAPCNSGWVIGRRAYDQYFPLLMQGNALRFDSIAAATKYVRALLSPTIIERPWAERTNLEIEVDPTP